MSLSGRTRTTPSPASARRRWVVPAVLTLATLASLNNLVAGQDESASPLAPVNRAEPSPGPTGVPTLDSVVVVRVRNPRYAADTTRPRAGIGDRIELTVLRLRDLVNHSKCLGTEDQEVPGCRPKSIVLYLDGREIKGLIPESGAPKIVGDTGTLQFHLDRGPESDEIWADLLGSPTIGSAFFLRPTEVSVGLEDSYALGTTVTGKSGRFHLVRIRLWRFWAAFIVLVGFTWGMFRLARHTNLLRDAGSAKPRPGDAPSLRPYSLARCQMAWWFVLTVASYLFIYTVTGASDTITPATLALMGISAATYLGSIALDARTPADGQRLAEGAMAQRNTLAADRDQLAAEMAALDRRIADPANSAIAKTLATTREELRRKFQRLATAIKVLDERMVGTAKASSGIRTRGFLADLLEDDETGPSFHRYQMFVWTIVLGGLFLVGVYQRLAMPEFSATLLGLMGISGGTYLGFKVPERRE